MSEAEGTPTLVVERVSKRFGSTLAVDDASFAVGQGELVGIAGHNGAGKSTILKIVNGALSADSGTVTLDGAERPAERTVAHPEQLGVRTVYQELSLCATLRVDETAAVFDRSARGKGWRAAAWQSVRAVLDDMFPTHGIRAEQRIQELSLARRQMLECAAAMIDSEVPPKLVILDEPTSSLDAAATESFYAYLQRRSEQGLSAIVTTHRLNEMIGSLSRIYVMRDGKVVSEQKASGATKASLVAAMGVAAHQLAATGSELDPSGAAEVSAKSEIGAAQAGNTHQLGPVSVRIEQPDAEDPLRMIELHAGEIVGLAGLEGHGQLEVLEAMLKAASSIGKTKRPRRTRFQVISASTDAAYVSGDRRVRGIFEEWNVARNMTFSSLEKISKAGVINPAAEHALLDRWWQALGIKGRPTDSILSLSGGTQQKALMARAMAKDAGLLLLEDPTRGVDQATKNDVYALLREQADAGQCVVWYSTENEELRNCDRVMVLQSRRIIALLTAAEATEARIIELSFESERQHDDSSDLAVLS